jgi:hypothetical protein
MSTRIHFDILRCRDAESDSCDSLLWDGYASADRQISRGSWAEEIAIER